MSVIAREGMREREEGRDEALRGERRGGKREARGSQISHLDICVEYGITLK